jgi:SAM-dependent methyltransferase
MTGAEKAFDAYAVGYDLHFTGTITGRMQRERVWKLLSDLDPSNQPSVLELNCGTGEDAAWFAKKGFKHTATDLSAEMICCAEEKLHVQELSARFRKADIRDVPQVLQGEIFHVVFSDFGGMNCLSPDELKRLSSGLQGLLEPGGKLIFVIMGRNCRWERFYFRRKGKKTEAERRKSKGPVQAMIKGVSFPVWYYSPAEFYGFFEKEFSFIRKKPVGLFIPPSYLDSWFVKHRGWLRLLGWLEKQFSFYFFADLADHYYLEMKSRKS